MIKQKIKPGSTFLFGLIRIFIGIFTLSSITLIAMGIWFWTQLNKFSWTEIVFIGFGVFELLLTVLGCTAQRSKPKLICFLYIVGVLFIVELTAAIIVFAMGQQIIDDIVNKTDFEEQWQRLHDYLFYVNAVVLATIVVQLLLVLMVKCYIGSLKDKNSQYDYKFVDDEGNKLTVLQKNKIDQKNIQEKYSKKREEMYEKYGRPPPS